MLHKNLANTKLKTTATDSSRQGATTTTTTTITKRTLTPTTNQFDDNLVSVDKRSLSRQLLLKKQLRLNLNVRADDELMKPIKKIVQDEDQRQKFNVDDVEISNDAAAAAMRNVVSNYSDDIERQCRRRRRQITNENLENIVPEQRVEEDIKKHEPLSSTSTMSLLKSSPTALAKFNRIIDATVPTTNVYQSLKQQQQQQQNITLAYRNIVSTDSRRTIATTTTYSIEKSELKKCKEFESADNYLKNDNIKRNDVHYLLKQLNSFSDIEEIEIVDMQQKKRQKQQEQEDKWQPTTQVEEDEQQQQQQQIEKFSPTTQSLVLVSPSTLSHKGIRRYASLHQQQITERELVASSLSQQLPPTATAQYSYTTMAGGGVQQFDDYLFQSCHYLETNNFAANYRTAMVESCSHEFRPSLTTTTGTTSASYSSHSSLHTFDLHETEPPSVICKATPPLPTSQQQQENENMNFDLNDDVDDNIDDYDEQQHPYVTHAQQPPALGPPPRRFQMQARLTSSGVQTELTASSLSTAATNASLAKSSTMSHHTTSTSSSSEVAAARARRKPFFKCCYTRIDRWRERRAAASATATASANASAKRPTEQTRSGSEAASLSRKREKEKEAAAGSAV